MISILTEYNELLWLKFIRLYRVSDEYVLMGTRKASICLNVTLYLSTNQDVAVHNRAQHNICRKNLQIGSSLRKQKVQWFRHPLKTSYTIGMGDRTT